MEMKVIASQEQQRNVHPFLVYNSTLTKVLFVITGGVLQPV
jgi:hypothetical protein